MLLNAFRLLVSPRGRIARSTFWLTGLAAGATFVVLLVFLESQVGRAASLALYPPLLWIVVALSAKRMRDRGRSPLWLLAGLVPVVGPLWLFVELGCRRGTVGENQYGGDPYDRRPDYLAVDLS